MSNQIKDEIEPTMVPFDEKMRIIRSYAYGFWVLEDKDSGNLEGRIDYEGYTTFVGNSPFIDDVINEVYRHLYYELLGDMLWQENDSRL